MNRIIFLGTGGGNYVTISQVRKTGGIYLELEGKKIIIDPGPGCLLNAQKLKLNPQKWDVMLLSHLHPDHSTDANIILSAMHDEKTGRTPIVLADRYCIELSEDDYPCISKYHQSISEVHPLEAGDSAVLDGITVKATRADHYAPTIGFVIETKKRKIGYVSDGTYYEGQENNYEGCDILILNVLVPNGKEPTKNKHMSTGQAAELLSRIKQKPRLAIIQHFSFWMLKAMPAAQAKIIENASGARTIAAEDFMELDIDSLKTKKSI